VTPFCKLAGWENELGGVLIAVLIEPFGVPNVVRLVLELIVLTGLDLLAKDGVLAVLYLNR
jgi:hypothetical protein